MSATKRLLISDRLFQCARHPTHAKPEMLVLDVKQLEHS